MAGWGSLVPLDNDLPLEKLGVLTQSGRAGRAGSAVWTPGAGSQGTQGREQRAVVTPILRVAPLLLPGAVPRRLGVCLETTWRSCRKVDPAFRTSSRAFRRANPGTTLGEARPSAWGAQTSRPGRAPLRLKKARANSFFFSFNHPIYSKMKKNA